jgi:hypothetical protein
MSGSSTERSNFRGNRPLSSNPPHSICVTDRKVVSFTHLWTIDHFQSYLGSIFLFFFFYFIFFFYIDDPQSPRVLFSSYFSPNFGPHTDTRLINYF